MMSHTLILDVELDDLIEDLKHMIQKIEGIDRTKRLIFNGKELENENTLLFYNITKHSTLEL